METIVTSNPSSKFEEDRKYLGALIDAGLQTYHLRKPRASTKKIRDFLDNLPNHYYQRIIIHSHPELLKDYNLKGFFMGHEYQKSPLKAWYTQKWMRWKFPDKLLSTGFYSGNKLMNNSKKFDYAFFGPIFTLKKGGRQAIHFDELELKILLRKSSAPIMARGGITLENIDYISKLGFEGVVLQSYLWEQKDPVDAFLKVREKLSSEGTGNITKLPLTS